jgi:hypothetical protein
MCSKDLQLGYALMNLQHEHVAWTSSKDMQHGHAAWTFKVDMQRGHAAWT